MLHAAYRHTPIGSGPRALVTCSPWALPGSVATDTWGSWGGDLWLACLGS